MSQIDSKKNANFWVNIYHPHRKARKVSLESISFHQFSEKHTKYHQIQYVFINLAFGDEHRCSIPLSFITEALRIETVCSHSASTTVVTNYYNILKPEILNSSLTRFMKKLKLYIGQEVMSIDAPYHYLSVQRLSIQRTCAVILPLRQLLLILTIIIY